MTEKNENDLTLWSIINTFIKWRRILAFTFVITAVITFIIASFLPKYYSSHASIFPPEKDSGSLGLASSLLSGGFSSIISGSGMSLPAFASLSDVYASILRSRIVAEGVITKHNLQEVYDIESLEKTIARLGSLTSIVVEPDGIINISVEDKNPELAAQLVESFIAELNIINTDVRNSKARATREFIEERLDQTKVDLAKAEDDYKVFQEEHQAVSLDAQLSALIGNLAELKSQLVIAEIELGVLKNTLQPTHTDVLQKKAQIAEIKKQIEKLEKGVPGDGETGALSIPFSEAPDLGLELARLTRELKIQETIFEILMQQYEQAKISEKRNTPTIQVLDPPKVPERKSRPKRLTMSVIAGILAFMLTITAIFIKEAVDRHKAAQTLTYRYLENALSSLKSDFYALRSIFTSGKRGSNGQSD